MPILDSLLFGELTDKKGIVMFAYNAILQSLDDPLLTTRNLDHVALCILELYAISKGSFAILVMLNDDKEYSIFF